MHFSVAAVQWFNPHEFSFIEKMLASLKYFLGFLGIFSFGYKSLHYKYILGLLVLILSTVTLLKRKRPSNALIIIGLIACVFNILLNCFAASKDYNINMSELSFNVYRRNIVNYFGAIWIIGGFIESVSISGIAQYSKKYIEQYKYIYGVFFFGLWFLFSGWAKYALSHSDFLIYQSQWRAMSKVIDSGYDVCVPTDSAWFLFSRNCSFLNKKMQAFDAKREYYNEPVSSIVVAPPKEVLNRSIISLAIFFKPQSAANIIVSGDAIFEMKDGSVRYMIGSRESPPAESLLMFTTSESKIRMSDVRKVTLLFNIPVKVAHIADDPGKELAIFWMGN
jgi:hypothetical protein